MNPLNLIPAPYRIAALAIAVALVFAATFALGWSNGGAHVQAKWDAAIAKQSVIAAQAEQAAREKERSMQQQKDEAINAAAERETKLRDDYDAVRAANLGLRDTVTAVRGQLSVATVEACRGTAEAALAVFSECTDRYREVAEAADRYGSAAETLSEAWPE